jgi:type IV fimbrial biogenesis protein FimT
MSKGMEMARMLMPRPQDLKGTQGFRGFTLIELMVTISIMAILLMIAVPSFQNATLGSKLSSFANGLVASAHLARSEAIKRNADVTLCVSNSDGTDGGSGGWEDAASGSSLPMVAPGSLGSIQCLVGSVHDWSLSRLK